MDAPLPPLPAQDKRVKPMEGIMITNSSQEKAEKKVIIKGDQKELAKGLNCPRCNSSNTKFCYYNNYSQTQPRYFCKACKRYWTQGGSLRSIPVGGKIRKNKRQSSSSSSYVLPNATKIKLPNLVDHHSSINPNPKLSLFDHHPWINPPNNNPYDQYKSSYSFNNSPYLSPMELVSSSSRGSVMASLMPLMQMSDPNPNSVYPVGFSFQGDYRPSLGFSLDDFGRVDHNKAADHDVHQDHIIGDQLSTRGHDDHQNGDSTGFWTGNILGGAGSW